MKLGFIGLGKMGSRMVEKLLEEGHEVVVWNRSPDKIKNLKLKIKNYQWSGNLSEARDIGDLINQLKAPRVIWLMLPALRLRSGSSTEDPTQEILNEVSKYVVSGDIIVDGGNAKFSDTQRRYEAFKEKNIRFLGIGVSGGLIARDAGYPLMVGGDKSAYEEIKPILDSLAKPNGGHEYFGEGGAGHYVKMIHNGIEYGYMQAIGEGFGVMDKSPYGLDLVKVAKLYQKGTLLSGFMMDRTVEALEADPKLEKIDGVIDASGEAKWAIEEAEKNDLPIEIIDESLEFREKSKTDPKISSSFAARMVAALRNAFGGHAVKKGTKD